MHHNQVDLNTILINEVENYLPESFINNIKTLRLMPLYELIEKLFEVFEMQLIANQDAYLFAFFDWTICKQIHRISIVSLLFGKRRYAARPFHRER